MKLLTSFVVIVLAACGTNHKNSSQSELASVDIKNLATVAGIDFTDGKLQYSGPGEADTVTFKKMEQLQDLRFVAGEYTFNLSYLKNGATVLSSANCSAELQSQNKITLIAGNNAIKVHVCEGSGDPVDTVTGSITPVIHDNTAPASIDFASFLARGDMRLECSAPDQTTIAITRKSGALSFEIYFHDQWNVLGGSSPTFYPDTARLEFKPYLKRVTMHFQDVNTIKSIDVTGTRFDGTADVIYVETYSSLQCKTVEGSF